MPNLLFQTGLAVSITAIIGAIISIIALHIYKKRLDKRLDADYGAN